MKYEDIENANKQIRTIDIERTDKKTGKKTKKEYVEVNQRIKAFRMLCPEGTIETELIKLEDGICVIKATISTTNVYFDVERNKLETYKRILGTGYAYEEQESSYINQTSFLENAETSAVGRALGMCGFGIDTSVASAEEMKSVENQELHNRLEIAVKIKKLMASKKITPDEVYEKFQKKSDDMSDEELQDVLIWLENKNE